jgi:hypothetical protein
MKLANRTPLAVMAFPMVDIQGETFLTVVAKGAFEVRKDEPLRLAETKASIRTTAIPWEGDRPSSLRYDDDLGPFKPYTDVIVNGTAYAPGGVRSLSWRAGIEIGALAKYVTVTGPRAWVHTPFLGWALTDIVAVRSVRLRYEHAFGGAEVEQNPVGIGACDPRKVDKKATIDAPRILTADGRTPRMGEAYPVEGFGALAKSWQPRRARAGTFDEAWMEHGGRRLPDDFDATYWNAAHSDLQAEGFLCGDEEVMLTALHPEHAELGFRLPSLIVAVGAVHASGLRHGSPARLDTVLIDADELRAELTWRATLPVFEGGIDSVHVAMRAAPRIGDVA